MGLIVSIKEWLPDKPGGRDKAWDRIGSLQVAGDLNPDATGVYHWRDNERYSGQPVFRGPDGWVIWFHAGANFWVLSQTEPGGGPQEGWAKFGPDFEGEYNPIMQG